MPTEMLYLKQNANIPFGIVTSTARKGAKWGKIAAPGDVLDLVLTEGREKFGQAVVTKIELVTLDDVLLRTHENHTGQVKLTQEQHDKYVQEYGDGSPYLPNVLLQELRAAYGNIKGSDEFTMVHFIRVNETTAPVRK
jgi:hypothetical protein